MGTNWGQIALMVPCLSVIEKSWRASLSFRRQHVLSLYAKNILIFFATCVHMDLFAPLTTCVLLKQIQT